MSILRHLVCILLLALSATSYANDLKLQREAVLLSDVEREWLLGQMRGQLASVQSIVLAISKNNNSKAAAIAYESGMAKTKAADQPASIKDKVPAKWKSYAGSMYKSFDDLSLSLSRGENTLVTLERLADLMSTCTTCHESFRITQGRQ